MSDVTGSVRRIFAAFNDNAVDEVADVIDEGMVDHHVPPGFPPGPEGVRAWWAMLHEAFDCRLEVDDVVAGEDRVATRLTFSGTHTGTFLGHPATNRSFSSSFMSIERFDGGRLVERWEVGDVLGMLQQLELVDPGGGAP
jgi:predicted ester cyclase